MGYDESTKRTLITEASGGSSDSCREPAWISPFPIAVEVVRIPGANLHRDPTGVPTLTKKYLNGPIKVGGATAVAEASLDSREKPRARDERNLQRGS